MDLLSIDLLLNDPAQPGDAIWPGFGVAGEVPANMPIERPPLLERIRRLPMSWPEQLDKETLPRGISCGDP